MPEGIVVHDSLSVSRGPLRRSSLSGLNERHARYAHPLSCTIQLVDLVSIDNYRRTWLKTHRICRPHAIHPALLTSKHCPSKFSHTSLPFAWRHLIISTSDILPGYRLRHRWRTIALGHAPLWTSVPMGCHYVGLRLSWSAPEQC